MGQEDALGTPQPESMRRISTFGIKKTTKTTQSRGRTRLCLPPTCSSSPHAGPRAGDAPPAGTGPLSSHRSPCGTKPGLIWGCLRQFWGCLGTVLGLLGGQAPPPQPPPRFWGTPTAPREPPTPPTHLPLPHSAPILPPFPPFFPFPLTPSPFLPPPQPPSVRPPPYPTPEPPPKTLPSPPKTPPKPRKTPPEPPRPPPTPLTPPGPAPPLPPHSAAAML